MTDALDKSMYQEPVLRLRRSPDGNFHAWAIWYRRNLDRSDIFPMLMKPDGSFRPIEEYPQVFHLPPTFVIEDEDIPRGTADILSERITENDDAIEQIWQELSNVRQSLPSVDVDEIVDAVLQRLRERL